MSNLIGQNSLLAIEKISFFGKMICEAGNQWI